MRSKLYILALCALMLGVVTLTQSSQAGSKPRPLSPVAAADVEIKLDGLGAIAMGDPSRYSLGILDVPHHTPQLLITRIVGQRRSVVAQLRGDQLRGSFAIAVEGGQHQPAKYQGSASDRNNFSWVLDMEGDLFQRDLNLRPEKMVGVIHVAAGLWYGKELSEGKFKFYSSDGKTLPFNRQIAAPAAKINLASGEALVVKGRKGELARLTAGDVARYEIEITNLPPKGMGAMDHFLFYYDALGVKVTAYQPLMTQKAAFLPPPMMCQWIGFCCSSLK